MYKRGWNQLIKTNDGYRYEPKTDTEKEHCTARLNFTQLTFDHDEECLIVTDTKDYLHYIDLSEDIPYHKRLEKVGRATFLAFNPICTGEVLIGIDTGDIKVWKLYTAVDEFSLLSGHKRSPTQISFYKNYCLTCSRSEVLIWHLQSYNKVHQLKVNTRDAVIKKALFSNVGHIVVLYHNDTIQAWTFRQLDRDIKIDTKEFGIRFIKDCIFTKDGRAMIMASGRNICILNTYDWRLLKKLSLPKIEARQLCVIPCLLDGGANKIIALLSSRCTLHFCDINTPNFLEMSNPISRIKKFTVSSTGRYIAYIDQEGCLCIMHVDKVISKKHLQPEKLESHKIQTHKTSEHLKCVKQSMKQELNVRRLMPILMEFGEYPDKYRAIIWSTILKLPANKSAYLALARKVTHGFTRNTLSNYPLADRSKASLLATIIDCLLQWCPLLVQCSFLPNLVFPFLTVFQKDPLLAFELILTILLNYCQNWFEYHPLPPLNILGIIENILLETDPTLLNIFCEHGITTSEYAWPLLQTAMSEVLSGNEWLILWDHLITFQKPSLLLMCVVAYCTYSRENIISLVKSSGNIKAFYSTQGNVRAKDLIKIARRLDQEMTEHTHPNRYLRDELLQLHHTGPYPLFMLKEYPKFLTEDSVEDLKKHKAQEQYSLEYQRKAAESAEKRRLHDEAEAFARRIHETRLHEARICSQEHIRKLYCQQLDKDTTDSQSERTQTCHESKSVEDGTTNFRNIKSRNYNKLRRDVTKLECEVQSFLDSLRSDKTKVSIS